MTPYGLEQCPNCDAFRPIDNHIMAECRNCGDDEIDFIYRSVMLDDFPEARMQIVEDSAE